MVRPSPPQVQIRTVREVVRTREPGFWTHPEWESEYPWLAQGTTGRVHGGTDGHWDFALFGEPPSLGARVRWEAMGAALGFGTVVHSHQVHGNRVMYHGHGTGSMAGVDHDSPSRAPRESGPPHRADLFLGTDADGHISRKEGVLFGVTVADCVPVFLVDPVSRVVGLLHAGWRGAVAGILEAALEGLVGSSGVDPKDIHMHLGPSICRDCFEVGPEVHRAMGLPESDGPRPVDLRGYLAGCGAGAGITPDRITESAWCTLCDGSPFFSHRRGEAGRQVGFLGIRASEESGPAERAWGR